MIKGKPNCMKDYWRLKIKDCNQNMKKHEKGSYRYKIIKDYRDRLSFAVKGLGYTDFERGKILD